MFINFESTFHQLELHDMSRIDAWHAVICIWNSRLLHMTHTSSICSLWACTSGTCPVQCLWKILGLTICLCSTAPAQTSSCRREFCVSRTYNQDNETQGLDPDVYQLEMGFHEMLLQSPHRTLDPEVRGSA